MSHKTPVAPVIIPLHPDAPAPLARGWHGMTERSHKQYDWDAWAAADPTGNPRMVDVALWSPAATAGIISGDYVVSLDGEQFHLWARHGAAVGACIRIIVYRPGAGRWAADVILAPCRARQRRQRPPRPTSYQQVPCGKRLGPKERSQWQAAMFDDEALTARARDLAARLAVKYADKANKAYPGRKRLARDLNVTGSTIDRAKALLANRGWLKWMSGRRTGETNRYWLTWPAVPPLPRRPGTP